MDCVVSWDTALFYFVNHNRCPFLDVLMAVLSFTPFIFAVIASIVFFVIWKKHFDRWYICLALLLLGLFLADKISVVCFKDVFCRLRPSRALPDAVSLSIKHWALNYNYKGGQYGFVSSHASNIFSIVTMAFLLLRKQKNILFPFCLMIFWGIITGYSRVYCGFHYPGDVLCGALLGVVVSLLLYWAYSLIERKINLKKSIHDE